MKYYTMPETRAFLESIGMPGGDLYDLPTSEKRFPDGGQYRFEVPGIQGPGPMKALLEALDEYGIQIHRVTQTKGIMFLTDDEISKMVEYAKKWNVQLVLACGPRATTDTSASVKTEEGQRMGYRLRGEEQIARGIEEIRRGARLGVRGFLVYDEGLLWALGEARKKGFIPADCHFKVSAHSGHGNPCSAHVLETLGADSINPVRDIQVQMLAAMRAAIDVPIDLHTENPKSSGGFIRLSEDRRQCGRQPQLRHDRERGQATCQAGDAGEACHRHLLSRSHCFTKIKNRATSQLQSEL